MCDTVHLCLSLTESLLTVGITSFLSHRDIFLTFEELALIARIIMCTWHKTVNALSTHDCIKHSCIMRNSTELQIISLLVENIFLSVALDWG